jgi:tRNA(Ile)-lysidine synthase
MNCKQAIKLEQKILKILETNLPKNATIIAGISGGPDSVFLLYMLNKLTKKIIIAHINHMIRKSEAKQDENFVKSLAKNFNNIFKLKTSNIITLSKKLHQGLEETGRKIRYEFFTSLAKKNNSKFILTAHHADDNLETIISNFTRGASLKGLSGMSEIEKLNNGIKLIRPLLSISKKEINDYLKFKKIKFTIDKTNKNTIYKRNFIRHKIIPLFKKLNPSISNTIAKNIENIKEINSFIQNQALVWIKKNSTDKTFTSILGKPFTKLEIPLQKAIIYELFKIHKKTTQNLETSRILEILKIFTNKNGNKYTKINGLKFSINKNIIKIEKEKNAS